MFNIYSQNRNSVWNKKAHSLVFETYFAIITRDLKIAFLESEIAQI